MGWSGPCARTMLVQPFQISPRSKTHQYLRNVPMHSVRGRREAGDDSGIWSDGLGIPWGIPDHYKALNPAANGLASTLCPWCVIGAHTDWINFLYYAEMKFQNLTRDGLQKIREELHANSRFNAAKHNRAWNSLTNWGFDTKTNTNPSRLHYYTNTLL